MHKIPRRNVVAQQQVTRNNENFVNISAAVSNKSKIKKFCLFKNDINSKFPSLKDFDCLPFKSQMRAKVYEERRKEKFSHNSTYLFPRFFLFLFIIHKKKDTKTSLNVFHRIHTNKKTEKLYELNLLEKFSMKESSVKSKALCQPGVCGCEGAETEGAAAADCLLKLS